MHDHRDAQLLPEDFIRLVAWDPELDLYNRAIAYLHEKLST